MPQTTSSARSKLQPSIPDWRFFIDVLWGSQAQGASGLECCARKLILTGKPTVILHRIAIYNKLTGKPAVNLMRQRSLYENSSD
ncbi:hypothetical protein [Fontibacillus sp. BL9]|uniref:hypothetical protein n=1 Tax=Fontibacillus sp. BL9 TaxID=3389971 RepID=UPI00397CE277